MRRRSLLLLAISLACLPLAGCQSSARTGSTAEPFAVSLGMMPEPAPTASEADCVRLGAGDALGYEVFTYYVACLRAAETYYANEPDSPFPPGE